MGLALFRFHWLKLKIEVLGFCVSLALDSDASFKPSTSSCELPWLNFVFIMF